MPVVTGLNFHYFEVQFVAAAQYMWHNFMYLFFRILMYVKRHEQFEIGCGALLNKIYYYYLCRDPSNRHLDG